MNGTNQNQSLGKNELRHYFIRLTILLTVCQLESFFSSEVNNVTCETPAKTKLQIKQYFFSVLHFAKF